LAIALSAPAHPCGTAALLIFRSLRQQHAYEERFSQVLKSNTQSFNTNINWTLFTNTYSFNTASDASKS